MTAWYNEPDEEKAVWLEELTRRNLIAPGVVDRRDIRDVRGCELAEFVQCHFFAGIGGWSYSLRRAGWPDSRPVWTGSCPCGPFSSVGELERFSDERHLWPDWVHLIRERKPAVIFGEQVAAATEWLRLVRGDLEALGYAMGAAPIEAASAGAFHLRDRYWFVADCHGDDAERAGARCGRGGGSPEAGDDAGRSGAVVDGGALEWYVGPDGKIRPAESGIRLVADGIPSRVGLLRGFGDAIDPRPAIEFIGAYMDIMQK
jgi:DNA (cytosine-5)-methyltransferase 1